MKVLKDNLVDAGPQVVAKISEEREKVESRLRSANRTVAELENVAVELQGKLKRADEDSIKVVDACRTCNNALSNYAIFGYSCLRSTWVCVDELSVLFRA